MRLVLKDLYEINGDYESQDPIEQNQARAHIGK